MMHVIEEFEHLKISLEAINLATNNFDHKNYIGGGGFGKVYKGEVLLSGIHTIVALKRLDRRFGQGNVEFWKEIITLSLYKHKNIVSLLGFCDENDEKILIYEYASKGSLDSYLNNNDLKWIQRLEICVGAARGLAYLHDPSHVTHQRVLHRDIKSSNILMDENWNAMISDLGLSKLGPANQQYSYVMSNPVGTKGYCDPVYVKTGLLTKEADVYSFGVVLFEVLCGRLSIGNTRYDRAQPLIELVQQRYKENKITEIIHASLKGEIAYPCLQEFTTIAYKCLSTEIKERPEMIDVLSKLERALLYQYQYQYQAAEEKNQTPQREVAIQAAEEKNQTPQREVAIQASRDDTEMGWRESAKPLGEKIDLALDRAERKIMEVVGEAKVEASAMVDEIDLAFDKADLAIDKAELAIKNWWRQL